MLYTFAAALLLRAVAADITSACLCTSLPCGPCENAPLYGSTAGGTALRIYGSGFSATGGNQVFLTYSTTNVSRYYTTKAQVVSTTIPAAQELWGRDQKVYVMADGFTQFQAPVTFTYSPDATPWVSEVSRNGQYVSVIGNLTANGASLPMQLVTMTVGGVACAVTSSDTLMDHSGRTNVTCLISPITPTGAQIITVCPPLGFARFSTGDTTNVTGTHPVPARPAAPPPAVFQFSMTLYTPSGAIGSLLVLAANVIAGAQIFVGNSPCLNAVYAQNITCIVPLGYGKVRHVLMSGESSRCMYR